MDKALDKPFTFSLKLSKYLASAYVNIRNAKTLSTNMFASSFAVLFRIWIFTQLYEATFAEAQVTNIGEFTLSMTIWSLMLTQSFESASRPSVSVIISQEVMDGTFAYSVSKPYSYILFHLWSCIGRTIPLLTSNILIGTVMAFAMVGALSVHPVGIVLGFINLLLGLSLDFVISLTIGISALWIEDTNSLTSIYHKFRLVFGGLILPIALFPSFIKTITELLPFSQLYYSAARQVVAFNFDTFIQSITIQLFWIVIFAFIAWLLFQKGHKQVSVNGG